MCGSVLLRGSMLRRHLGTKLFPSKISISFEMLLLAPREIPLPLLQWYVDCLGLGWFASESVLFLLRGSLVRTVVEVCPRRVIRVLLGFCLGGTRAGVGSDISSQLERIDISL